MKIEHFMYIMEVHFFHLGILSEYNYSNFAKNYTCNLYHKQI